MASVVIIVTSTLGLPALELAVFWLRFRYLPPSGAAAAFVFVPMGFVAGVVAAILVFRATTSRQRRFVLWGYLIASPIALFGAPLGGLMLPGTWGALVAGAYLLSLGCLTGFVVGGVR